MLVSFAVTNHRSLRGRVELSAIAERNPTVDDRSAIPVPHHDFSLLPVVAVIGPNGSGKSNLLNALDWGARAVSRSQTHWPPRGEVPRSPFKAKHGSDDESTFEFEFLHEGAVYSYEFSVTSMVVVHERLDVTARGPRSRTMLFDRRCDRDGAPMFKFGRRLVGPRAAAEAATRPNSLFLSSAAQNNHAMLTPVWEWFRYRCRAANLEDREMRHMYTAERLLRGDDDFRERIRRFLSSADLGITDVRVSEEPLPKRRVEIARQMLALVDEDFEIPDDHEFKQARTVILHRGEVADLELEEESAGTRTWFEWAAPVLDTLDYGAVLGADELDAHLNEHLAARIVDLFQRQVPRATAAQLVFAAQDPAVITRARLGRDQVWVTEKSLDGDTELYPVTDFRSRREWDAGEAYRHGRYGGVPVIDEDLLARAVSTGS